MNTTPIEWCRTYHPDGSWTAGYSSNPVYVLRTDTGKRGWHCVGQGPECDNCYAQALNKRWGTGLPYLAVHNGAVTWVLSEKELTAWEKLDAKLAAQGGPPARVFVGDMLDLFHPDVPDNYLDRIFAVAARCRHLILLFLTKQPRRMQAVATRVAARFGGPLPNVGFGVSCGVDKARWRIRILRKTPAALRYLSCEPLLEEVHLYDQLSRLCPTCQGGGCADGTCDGRDCPILPCPAPCPTCQGEGLLLDIAWVIAGGESGPHARPLDLDWVRELRDSCGEVGAAFFFKQVGGRTPKAGGRLLDGREWNEFPPMVAEVAA